MRDAVILKNEILSYLVFLYNPSAFKNVHAMRRNGPVGGGTHPFHPTHKRRDTL